VQVNVEMSPADMRLRLAQQDELITRLQQQLSYAMSTPAAPHPSTTGDDGGGASAEPVVVEREVERVVTVTVVDEAALAALRAEKDTLRVELEGLRARYDDAVDENESLRHDMVLAQQTAKTEAAAAAAHAAADSATRVEEVVSWLYRLSAAVQATASAATALPAHSSKSPSSAMPSFPPLPDGVTADGHGGLADVVRHLPHALLSVAAQNGDGSESPRPGSGTHAAQSVLAAVSALWGAAGSWYSDTAAAADAAVAAERALARDAAAGAATTAAGLRDEAASLRASLAAAEATAVGLRQEVAALQAAVSAVTAEKTAALAAADAATQGHKAAAEAANAAAERLRAEVAAAQADAERRDAVVSTLQAELAGWPARMSKAVTEAVGVAEMRVATEWGGKVRDLEARLTAQVATTAAAEATLASLREEREATLTNLQAAKAEDMAQAIAMLRASSGAELERMRDGHAREMTAATDAAAAARAEAAASASQVTALSAALQVKTAAAEAAASRVAELTRQLDAAEAATLRDAATLQDLKASLNAATLAAQTNAERLSDAMRQINDAQGGTTARTRAEAAEEKMREFRVSVAALEQHVASLQRELAGERDARTAEAAASASAVGEVQRVVADLQAEKAALLDQIAALSASLGAANDRGIAAAETEAALREEIQAAAAALAASEERTAGVSRQLAEVAAEKSDVVNQVERLQGSCRSTEERMQHETSARRKAEQTVAALQSDLERLNGDLAAAQDAAATMLMEVQERLLAAERAGSLKAAELAGEVEMLTGQLASREAEIVSLTAHNASLQAQLAGYASDDEERGGGSGGSGRKGHLSLAATPARPAVEGGPTPTSPPDLTSPFMSPPPRPAKPLEPPPPGVSSEVLWPAYLSLMAQIEEQASRNLDLVARHERALADLRNRVERVVELERVTLDLQEQMVSDKATHAVIIETLRRQFQELDKELRGVWAKYLEAKARADAASIELSLHARRDEAQRQVAGSFRLHNTTASQNAIRSGSGVAQTAGAVGTPDTASTDRGATDRLGSPTPVMPSSSITAATPARAPATTSSGLMVFKSPADAFASPNLPSLRGGGGSRMLSPHGGGGMHATPHPTTRGNRSMSTDVHGVGSGGRAAAVAVARAAGGLLSTIASPVVSAIAGLSGGGGAGGGDAGAQAAALIEGADTTAAIASDGGGLEGVV